MISKVLFLVLFSAAHAQARPGIFPRLRELVESDSGVANNPVAETRERSSRDEPIVNDRTDEDYSEYANDNLIPSETGNGNANVNGDRVVSTLCSCPEINKNVATNRVATNDEANNEPVRDRALSTVLDQITTAEAMAEDRIRNSGVGKIADALGPAIGDVVTEKFHNLGRDVGSVFEVGRPALSATGGIVDSKMKLALSVPRMGERFFAALGKI